MRDRLIELLNDMQVKGYVSAKNEDEISCHVSNKNIADYLLEKGVIVPPCKVGDTVYVINRCRCGKPDCCHTKQCYKKITTKTPKFVDRVMMLEIGRKTKYDYFSRGIGYEEYEKGTICYSVYEKPFNLKMLTEVGKTVFLTREEAEAKLKGGEE